MTNKKTQSAGAEKAEKIAAETASAPKKTSKKNHVKSASSTEKKTGGARKTASARSTGGKKSTVAKPVRSQKTSWKKSGVSVQADDKRAARKQIKAEKKLHLAELRAAKKQKRLESKLEHKQRRLDRLAALKEKREERKAEKLARRERLKNETKAMRLKRKQEEKQAKREARIEKRRALAAERAEKREHRLLLKAEKRAAKNERRHAPGFGGWLAAVISLGVTTLALGAVVTYGWITMNGMQAEMTTGHTQSVYELNAIVDNLDAGLAKAQVAVSSQSGVKTLSDIAIQSEMAEVVLERLPVDIPMTEELSSFLNKMGDSAQGMLVTLAQDGELTESQTKTLSYLYETNKQIKQTLNGLVSNMGNGDILAAMRGKGSILSESFTELQNNVIQEPKGIQDGPFADSTENTTGNAYEQLEEISSARAEELAMNYFSSYKPHSAHCTGEATAATMPCYNVDVETDDGTLFVQLSRHGGRVVLFESHKNCTQKNFSTERCVDIAEEFLENLELDGMKAVWVSENGTVCNLHFAPVQDGVILYPDLIKVKVCEERGIVTGMEGLAYALNHSERTSLTPTLTKAEAKAKLGEEFTPTAVRTALIPLDGEEILTYEFFGEAGENEYYVYMDATSGEVVEVLTIIGTAQGKSLL